MGWGALFGAGKLGAEIGWKNRHKAEEAARQEREMDKDKSKTERRRNRATRAAGRMGA